MEYNIGMLIPVCSRNQNYTDISSTPLFSTFLKHFENNRSNHYNYIFFIGVDDNDDFYLTNKNHFTLAGMNVVILSDCNHKPAKAWNKLLEEAIKHDIDYFFQIGDDIELLTTEDWTGRFINKLKDMDNIGIVGPCNSINYIGRINLGKPLIIENVFFHRRHHQMFGTLFHESIDNWYCDDWIFGVYNFFNKAYTFTDILCSNNITGGRYHIKELPEINNYIQEGIDLILKKEYLT